MWVLSTMQIGVRTHRKKDPKDGEAARLARAKIARKEEQGARKQKHGPIGNELVLYSYSLPWYE